MVRIPDRATQERINAAGVQAYHVAVEKLIARADAVRPDPIRDRWPRPQRRGKGKRRPVCSGKEKGGPG